MFDTDFFRDPYSRYGQLRGQCPVQRVATRAGRYPFWLITGYPEARAALADPRLSKDTRRFEHLFTGDQRDIAPAVRFSILATDPPDHTRLRRLATQAFNTPAAERLLPRIQQTCTDLITGLKSRGRADLIAEVAIPLPLTTICDLLAVPEADRDQLHRWSNALFLSGDPQARDKASYQLSDYMSGLIAGKRTHPDQGLVSDLIAARDEGDRLTEQELISLITVLLVAGHETTTTLIGNTVLALLTHPAAFEAARTSPAALAATVEETLRHDAPLGIATIRFTREPVRYGDTDIPADEIVMVSLGAANRDPRQFPVPDTFDPARTTSGHLAFGHGPHYCPGAHLARLQAHTVISALISELPRLRLDVDINELRWRSSRQMRGLQALPVTW